MSKRDFTKVSPAVWRSNRFRRLATTDAQLLYLYFLTCEHQNSAGCFRIPDGYACADLGWETGRYVTARDTLVDGEMVSFDQEGEVVYIRRWFKHSPPMNDKHAVGTRKIIADIENDSLREVVEAEFDEADRLRMRAAAEKSASDQASRRASAGYEGGMR